MMILYAFKGACSMVPHIALQWIGEPFELHMLGFGENKEESYLKMNPQGAVPVIKDGEFSISQNVGIMEYLDKKYPNAHLLGGGDEKAVATAWRWFAFCNSDLHKAFGPIFFPAGWADSEEAKAEVKEKGREKVVQLFKFPDQQLNGRDFLSGHLSAADAYLYVTTRWALSLNLDLSGYKDLMQHAARMEQDDGVKKVLVAEELKHLL